MTKAMPRVLIADDEKGVRIIASRALKSEGFLTEEYADGQEAYQAILSREYDLLLIDINMPGMDGFSIIEKVREKGIQTPIIIITGNDEEYNEVYGFSIGADNYIIKPFRPSALAARAKALLRRSRYTDSSSFLLKAGPFCLDKNLRLFYKNGTALELTPKEALLLQYFMENIGQVLSKQQLYEKVWREKAVDDNTIMVCIRHLRCKIEDNAKEPVYIQTVYGFGYKFILPENIK